MIVGSGANLPCICSALFFWVVVGGGWCGILVRNLSIVLPYFCSRQSSGSWYVWGCLFAHLAFLAILFRLRAFCFLLLYIFHTYGSSGMSEYAALACSHHRRSAGRSTSGTAGKTVCAVRYFSYVCKSPPFSLR